MRRTPIKRSQSLTGRAYTPEEIEAIKAKRKAKNDRNRERRKKGDIPMKDIKAKADKLARAYCKRDGVCQAEGYRGIKCSPRLEWAHCVGRDEWQIRHHPDNCFCLCWAHHNFFTSHPYLWTNFVEERRPGLWQRMDDLLIEAKEKMLKPDYLFWIDWYTKRAA